MKQFLFLIFDFGSLISFFIKMHSSDLIKNFFAIRARNCILIVSVGFTGCYLGCSEILKLLISNNVKFRWENHF